VLVVAYVLAVAQPVLDLVGRAPEFLVAHDLLGLELAVVMVGFVVVPPLVVAAVIVGLLRLSPTVGRVALAAVTVALVALALLPLVDRLLPVRVRYVAAVAVILAGGFAFAHGRSGHVRAAVRAGLIAPVLSVGVFLLASPAGGLSITSSTAGVAVEAGEPRPIVVVVFDEFPTASLLDDAGELDAVRYPNFARLAERSTWYAGARTIAHGTQHAIPALLTGTYPEEGRQPVASHHPTNLFALLSRQYDVHAIEPITRLCPPEVCGGDERPPQRARLGALARDARVIHGLAALPAGVARHLPDVTQEWAGFAADEDFDFGSAADEELDADPGRLLARFLDSLGPAEDPVLHYLHVLVPHSPWRYLPDGQRYPGARWIAGRQQGEWVGDPWQVAQGQQRHLLQVQAVDRFVGEFLDRLEETGLMDDAVVVVTADHGVAFRPGGRLRTPHPTTYSDLAYVPLFVRVPGESEGEVVERTVEIVDIVPTIADVIGMDLPTAVDGHDLREPDVPARPERLWLARGRWEEFPGVVADPRHPVEVRQRVLGPLPRGADLFLLGTWGDLVGQPLADVSLDLVPIGVGIEEAPLLDDVHPSGEVLPAFLRGCVDDVRAGTSAERGDEVLLALNGVVAASTQLSEDDDGATCFSAVMAADRFVEGRNEVTVHLVR
jgi:hypothetical protein